MKAEILAELWKGTPFAEIRGRFRSQSQLYEAIREFLDKSEDAVSERQGQLSLIEDELARTQTRLAEARRDEKKVLTEAEKLRKEKEALSKSVSDLSSSAAELERRGFTSDILSEIKKIGNRSGSELLNQLQTVEDLDRISKDLSSVKENKKAIEATIKTLEKRGCSLETRIVSEKNRLDDLKLRTATMKNAVAVVASLFKKGYNSEDIKSLHAGLEALEIKGDQTQSITRLVHGLKKQKGLSVLEETISSHKEELGQLQKAEREVKDRIHVLKRHTLGAIEEARNTSIRSIASVANEANACLKEAAVKLESRCAGALGRIDTNARQAMTNMTYGFDEWRRLQEEKAKLGKNIEYGRAFMSVLSSNEHLAKVPLSVILQLVARLRIALEIRLPDCSVWPSENVHKRDSNLHTWSNYNLVALIELVEEGILKELFHAAKEHRTPTQM